MRQKRQTVALQQRHLVQSQHQPIVRLPGADADQSEFYRIELYIPEERVDVFELGQQRHLPDQRQRVSELAADESAHTEQ